MMTRVLWAAAAAVLLWASPTHAAPPNKRITFDLLGGVSFPAFNSAPRFTVGGAAGLGMAFNFSDRLAVQAEFVHTFYGLQAEALQTEDFDGHHVMRFGALIGRGYVMRWPRIGAYVVGGPGLYYRRVEVTRIEGTTTVPACSPLFFYCSDVEVTVQSVLGARHSMDFGVNGGLGVEWMLAEPLTLFLEARFHYIFGPQFEFRGETRRADGQYFPAVFGMRF